MSSAICPIFVSYFGCQWSITLRTYTTTMMMSAIFMSFLLVFRTLGVKAAGALWYWFAGTP